MAVIPPLGKPYRMLRHNLIDTGVTRGERLVALLEQPRAVAMAVVDATAVFGGWG